MSTSRRATTTVLACACGVAVASLATSAHPRDAGSDPTSLPETVAHPPLSRHYPLPADRQATVVVRGIGMRITPLAQTSFAVPTFDDGAIPGRVLAAYRRAADVLSRRDPSCHLHWSVIAGIGRIESGHAFGGALFADGRTATPILGPRLDGSLAGTATIPDSTGGRFDGDPVWERAVGPMQFLPSTWLSYGRDGNGDGVRDPHNVYDAALGTAVYLCAGERDLSRPADLRQALFSYNPSLEYVRAVLAWADHYAGLGPRPSAGHPVTYTLAASREPIVGHQDAPEPRTKPVGEPDDAPAPPSPAPTAPAGEQRPDSGDSSDTPPEPTEPSGPSEPAGPSGPTEPAEPTEPVAEPTEPAGPDDAVCEPPDSEGTTEQTPDPAEETADPAETTEPVETAEPAEDEDPTTDGTDPADPTPCELPTDPTDPDAAPEPEPATEPETAPSVQPG